MNLHSQVADLGIWFPNFVSEGSRGGPWSLDDSELRSLWAKLPPHLRRGSESGPNWREQLKVTWTDARLSPSFRWVVYSMCEGVVATRRVVTSARGRFAGSQGLNLPHRMHGLVADYDCEFDPDRVQKSIEKREASWKSELESGPALRSYMPFWIEKSLSDRMHLAWRFERSWICPPDSELTKSIITKLGELLYIPSFFPMFDRHSRNPWSLTTLGREWSFLTQEDGSLFPAIPLSLVNEVAYEVTLSHAKSRPDETEVPLDVAAKLLAEKFGPKFDWPGDFVLGSMGPTFWLEGSVSPKSAVVHAGGLYSFSNTAQEAGKSFWSWTDLLGAKVAEFRKGQISEVAQNYLSVRSEYYDISKSGSAPRPLNADQLRAQLRSQHGLSARVEKGSASSPVDDAITAILQTRSVSGLVHFPFRPRGLIPNPMDDRAQKGQSLVWNLSSIVDCMQETVASGYSGEWGPEGHFPTICQYLELMLPPAEGRIMLPSGAVLQQVALPQYELLVAWMQRILIDALKEKGVIRRGHALLLTGPSGTGKTLLGNLFLGNLFFAGSWTPAEDLIQADSSFNAHLWDKAFLLIDDYTPGDASDARIATALKKTVSQPTVQNNRKFRDTFSQAWDGRVMMSCNDDADSLRVVPPLSQHSMADKVLLLRACPDSCDFFVEGISDKLEEEFPHFMRWLSEKKRYPWEEKYPNHRFGFAAWHHGDVADQLDVTSDREMIRTMIESFYHFYYYDDSGPRADTTLKQVIYRGDLVGKFIEEVAACEKNKLRALSLRSPGKHRRFCQTVRGLVDSTTGESPDWPWFKLEDGRTVVLYPPSIQPS